MNEEGDKYELWGSLRHCHMSIEDRRTDWRPPAIEPDARQRDNATMVLPGMSNQMTETAEQPGQSDSAPDGAVQALFDREQRTGLTVALQGRLLVLAAVAIWFALTRRPPAVFYMEALVLLFALSGGAQLWIVGCFGVRSWLLYLLLFLEASVLVVSIVFFAAPMTQGLPIPMAYRFDFFPYFFLLVAGAAFSYAPILVFWSGLATVIAWGAAAAWVALEYDTLQWGDIPADAGPEGFMAVFLDPMFMGVGSRVQESIVLLCVAGLLAIVAWRARRVVYRQAAAERARMEIADTFGKYVPEAVAGRLIADSGALAPQQRDATVMFTDIEGFTGIAEHMRPDDILAMLDDYFDTLGAIIADENGVVCQFQGDALLATFNAPIDVPDHPAAGLRAAIRIQDTLARQQFHGKTLRTRIGLNTGPVVSGTVGSRGRRSYTVYGDTVNAAARIEVVNKDFGTYLLAAAATVEAAGEVATFEQVGARAMRGRSEPTTLYTVTPS
mgnify:CR=1 FL=1